MTTTRIEINGVFLARLALFLAVVAGFFVVQAQTKSDLRAGFHDQAVMQTAQLRAGCERQNGRSVALYHLQTHLIKANHDRVAAATSAQEAQANRRALHRYQRDRLDFLAAQSPVALRPNFHGPEGVIADCNVAFPEPK